MVAPMLIKEHMEVLGCDGVHSFVRESLDIAFEGVRLNEPHLVIDFAEFPDQSPFSRFFCDPRRPFNSILMPYGGRRIEFMLNDGDDREDIKSFESIRRLVDRHTPDEDHLMLPVSGASCNASSPGL